MRNTFITTIGRHIQPMLSVGKWYWQPSCELRFFETCPELRSWTSSVRIFDGSPLSVFKSIKICITYCYYPESANTSQDCFQGRSPLTNQTQTGKRNEKNVQGKQKDAERRKSTTPSAQHQWASLFFNMVMSKALEHPERTFNNEKIRVGCKKSATKYDETMCQESDWRRISKPLRFAHPSQASPEVISRQLQRSLFAPGTPASAAIDKAKHQRSARPSPVVGAVHHNKMRNLFEAYWRSHWRLLTHHKKLKRSDAGCPESPHHKAPVARGDMVQRSLFPTPHSVKSGIK